MPVCEFDKQVGRAISAIRAVKNHTSADCMSEAIGISRSSLTRYERGEQRTPAAIINKIARWYGGDDTEMVANAILYIYGIGKLNIRNRKNVQ